MRRTMLILAVVLTACQSADGTPQEQRIVPTGSVATETAPTPLSTPEVKNSDTPPASPLPAVSSPTATAIEPLADGYEIPPPDGAMRRIGRGGIIDVDISPDGGYLAVITTVGLYVYDMSTMMPVYLDVFDVGFLSPEPIPFARVKWSPDSRFVLGWTTGRAQLWDFSRQTRLFFWESIGYDFRFSPDSARIAVMNELDDERGKAIGIVDTSTGEVAYLPGIYGNSADWSPDGTLLAVSGSPTRLMATSTWQVLTEIDAATIDVRFSPDGTLLSGVFSDTTGRFWDVQTGEVRLTLEPVAFNKERAPYTAPLQIYGWSPDSSLYAIALEDGAYVGQHVAMWDAHTGTFMGETENVHLNFDASGILSPDFERLAFISDFEYVTVHEASTGLEIGRFLGAWALDTEWMPDSRRLVVVTDDSLINIWDVDSGTLVSSVKEHMTAWRCWGPDAWIGVDNPSLVSWGECSRTVVWDIASGQPVFVSGNLGKTRGRCSRTYECWPGAIQLLNSVASSTRNYLFDYTSQQAVLAYQDHVEVWRLSGATSAQLFASEGTPTTFEWPWDNQQVALGFTDRMEVWDTETATMVLTRPGEVGEFLWSDDSTKLAVAFTDRLELWDVAGRSRMADIPAGAGSSQTFPVHLWDWSADTAMLIFSTDTTATVLDANQGTALLEMRYTSQIAVPFQWRSGDRVFKFVGPWVVDLATRERLFAVRQGDDDYVGAVLVSPSLLALAGWDGTISLWQVDELFERE